jgi:hypothetical protein
MQEFFRLHPPPAGAKALPEPEAVDDEAIACDEELLRTFGEQP